MMTLMHEINESFVVDSARLEPLTESIGGKKIMFLEGVVAQSERLNANKRNYLRTAMEEAIDVYDRDYVSKNRSIGELNHPSHLKPNPERASQLITEVRMDGNDVYGKAKVLDELPMGHIVRKLYEAGVDLGVSTRAMGQPKIPKMTTGDIVKLRIYAIDNVADPSAQDAWPKPLFEAFESMNSLGMIDDTMLERAAKANKLGDSHERIAAFSKLMNALTESVKN